MNTPPTSDTKITWDEILAALRHAGIKRTKKTKMIKFLEEKHADKQRLYKTLTTYMPGLVKHTSK